MLTKADFGLALGGVTRDYERFAILGALLARATRLRGRLVIPGARPSRFERARRGSLSMWI